MNRCFVLSIALVAGLVCTSSAAQAEGMGIRIGADGAFVLPVSTWSDAASIGIGVLARGEYVLQPAMHLTGRLGYIYHLSKDVEGVSFGTSELPFLVGAKYYFSGEQGGLYGAAELGLVSVTVRGEVMGMSVSASETKFGVTAGAGFEMGGLDLRGQLFIPSLGDAGDFLGIMATVGYTFADL
jgi:hypothetical protein